jgi:hypothetical protein
MVGASFGSLTAVSGSLADAAVESLSDALWTGLALDAAAFDPDQLQQLRRPLFIVDQSLRLTASACNLGRELMASIQGHR